MFFGHTSICSYCVLECTSVREVGRSSNLSRVCSFLFLFLKKRSIVHFCRWRRLAVILVIFCGRHKCMSPKCFKITTNSVIRGNTNSFFFSIKPDTLWLPYRTTPSSPFPHSTDDLIKGLVTFSWHLIFCMKKIVAYWI